MIQLPNQQLLPSATVARSDCYHCFLVDRTHNFAIITANSLSNSGEGEERARDRFALLRIIRRAARCRLRRALSSRMGHLAVDVLRDDLGSWLKAADGRKYHTVSIFAPCPFKMMLYCRIPLRETVIVRGGVSILSLLRRTGRTTSLGNLLSEILYFRQ